MDKRNGFGDAAWMRSALALAAKSHWLVAGILAILVCWHEQAMAQSSETLRTGSVRLAGGAAALSSEATGVSSVLTATTHASAQADGKVRPASVLQTVEGPYVALPNVVPSAAAYPLRGYASYEALWLRREGDERFSLSRHAFLPDFDFQLGSDIGGRYTIGLMQNATDAWEFTYTGSYDWIRSGTTTGPGNLQSQFIPSGGFTNSEISTFNDADLHSQLWRVQLNSIELNRKWWEWDVVSTMIGVRFIDYEEDYLFFSSNSVGTGLFQQSVDNQMVGLQIGAEAMYPVSLRLNIGVRAKGGVYANILEGQTFLGNAGTVQINTGDDDVDVAGLIELGYFANYSVTPNVRIIGGYEIWYLPGVATVPEQSPQIVAPLAGSQISRDDDLIFHGGSVGVQVLY